MKKGKQKKNKRGVQKPIILVYYKIKKEFVMLISRLFSSFLGRYSVRHVRRKITCKIVINMHNHILAFFFSLTRGKLGQNRIYMPCFIYIWRAHFTYNKCFLLLIIIIIIKSPGLRLKDNTTIYRG